METEPRQHVWFKCEQPCDKPGTCCYCDGGLAFCTVCKQGECELEPTCPGPRPEQPRSTEAGDAGLAGEACKHGVRWPWACADCERDDPMPVNYDPRSFSDRLADHIQHTGNCRFDKAAYENLPGETCTCGRDKLLAEAASLTRPVEDEAVERVRKAMIREWMHKSKDSPEGFFDALAHAAIRALRPEQDSANGGGKK